MIITPHFLVSCIFAAAGLGYGLPLLRKWERTWPWERWILYSLTITAMIFFVWSLLI